MARSVMYFFAMAFSAYTHSITMTMGIFIVATGTHDPRGIPPHWVVTTLLNPVSSHISLPCPGPLETSHSCRRREVRKSVSHHRRKRLGHWPRGAVRMPPGIVFHP